MLLNISKLDNIELCDNKTSINVSISTILPYDIREEFVNQLLSHITTGSIDPMYIPKDIIMFRINKTMLVKFEHFDMWIGTDVND